VAFENKKQLLIIVGAVAAGIVAVVLTSNYVKTSIQNQTAALSEQFDARQKEMVSQIQQRSDQQMAALAQELQRVKVEQAATMEKQMAALQQAQQEAARMKEAQEVKKAAQTSLALKIPQGKRAVTVTIDSLAAVGGLINAGDFVDVIAQLNVPAQETDKKTVTAMIFQRLQVLAVNTNIEQPGSYQDQQAAGSLKITFAVDPQEAGLLAFADKNGTLELALRAPDEGGNKKVKANTWKTLADYVLKNQGLNIQNPDGDNPNKPAEGKTNIQIFRRGQEL
jgi:pilus assembly protein CpaB